jgi:hypothetical protein
MANDNQTATCTANWAKDMSTVPNRLMTASTMATTIPPMTRRKPANRACTAVVHTATFAHWGSLRNVVWALMRSSRSCG